MVGYHKRSDPAVMFAKTAIDELQASGELGELRYVRISMPTGDWVANGFVGLVGSAEARPTDLRREISGDIWNPPDVGGMPAEIAKQYIAFVNFYIHQVNLMRHLLGEPYLITYADKSDVILAVRCASGRSGVIEMMPYQTTVAWEEHALVCFDRGYVRVDLPAPLATNRAGTIEIYKDPGNGVTPQRIQPTMPWVHAMRQQAINFVNVCRGEMSPPCDAAEAAIDLDLARQYVELRFGDERALPRTRGSTHQPRLPVGFAVDRTDASH
jgi:predicted dehydrogenase